MDRDHVWAMFFAAATIADKEKPPEAADSMMREYDKRFPPTAQPKKSSDTRSK